MTAKEFAALQEVIGWSNRRLGDALGVSDETVSRWRHGYRIPGPAQLAVKALASGWRL